ncbi:MAG: helix-hairpin-helix domain-containing protein [Planctomycetota bacterium]
MPEPLLRPSDQRSIAGLTAIALVSMGGWWLLNGGMTGRLINIDRATPQSYQFLVDVNTATWPELAQLPEVGEILARRIIENRQANGPYQRPEDLLRVSGIGAKKLQRVRGFLLPLPGEEFTAER